MAANQGSVRFSCSASACSVPVSQPSASSAARTAGGVSSGPVLTCPPAALGQLGRVAPRSSEAPGGNAEKPQPDQFRMHPVDASHVLLLAEPAVEDAKARNCLVAGEYRLSGKSDTTVNRVDNPTITKGTFLRRQGTPLADMHPKNAGILGI
jgi:hypothetical protein